MKPFDQSETMRAATVLSTIVLGGIRVGPAQTQEQKNRRPLMFRASTLTLVLLLALLPSAPLCYAQAPPSLMTMIAQWQYPDSKMNGATMSDAATLNGTGERTVQSIQYKTVLTTTDPLPKVLEYYKNNMMPKAGSKTAKPQE